jgi:hypothetical protein
MATRTALATLDPTARLLGRLCVLSLGAAGAVLLLLMLFRLPVLIMGLALAGVVAVGWVLFCARYPLAALVAVFFIFVLAYARLSLGAIAVAGPSTTNRGAIAVGDLLWLGLVAGAVIRWGLLRRRGVVAPILAALDSPLVWLMAPYVVAAVALPILGVLSGDWPLSFAIPGVRVLQYVALGAVGYLLAVERGAAAVLKPLLITLAIVGVLHLAYATVQLAYFEGYVGRIWIALDDLYAVQNNVGWFFYPRLTGLLVNPNAYGLLGAFMIVAAAANYLARGTLRWPWLAALLACGGFAMALSGSRSALLGTGMAILLLGLLALRSDRLMTRLLKIAFAAPAVVVGLALTLWPLLPGRLQARYNRFISVMSTGADADINASVRVEMWADVLRAYWADYPLGTWVPASFALERPIDSYYVYSMAQGSPAFTILWLVCFAAVIALGWRVYTASPTPLEAAGGVALVGWAGVLLGGSVTLSPVLQPQLIAPFWLLTGIVLASHVASLRQSPAGSRP